MHNVIDFSEIGIGDIDTVGGKNSSLGEMIRHLHRAGIKVPPGFATTAEAYYHFLSVNQLDDKIFSLIDKLDNNNLAELNQTGKQIRQWILNAPFDPDFEKDIKAAYFKLNPEEKWSVAVRSSATAEDLVDASFAGQQETYLNVQGIDAVLLKIKAVYASLFTDRAISYRHNHGFKLEKIGISVGIQRMIRSDLGASGVAFSIDTESGFDQVVFITSAYGLGEGVVSGAINPDEFYAYKPNLIQGKPSVIRRNLGEKAQKMIYAPEGEDKKIKFVACTEEEQIRYSLSNDDVEKLAKMVLNIEQHYQRPMDVEWGKDGIDGEIYILQARPETVKSQENSQSFEQFVLLKTGTILATGKSIGQKIGQGPARLINHPQQMQEMKPGEVLVTDMTDPDWEPIMKIASAIVTNRGGRTCHAAIIARELGIPAVVGCSDATKKIQTGQEITVSCAEGETGYVYEGKLPFQQNRVEINNMPELPFDICLNLGNPDKAFAYQSIPNKGVGLARLEFIISNMIGIHPSALLNLESLEPALRQQILKKTAAYSSPVEYYIERLKEGIATIASAFYPRQVIVRMSDFKSNEYANLLGGQLFEPSEENPMIGFRGASRYIAPNFKPCFELECIAMKRVREELGLSNAHLMIPFVRTVTEAKEVINTLKEFGLTRGDHGLKFFMMCEIPSNAILAEEFLQYFDGFSIGSNDLTQLTLGLDRDSSLVANIFDERNAAVKALLAQAISTCRRLNKYVGICGQGPSDHPDLAKWLMEQGISSVSLSPDTVIKTWLYLANEEATAVKK